MKLSTKGRYGLRSMVDLAYHAKGEHVSLYQIAERQQISENYLEQVFSLLRKGGFVKSIKGAQGGYNLAGSPVSFRVLDILQVLEGDLFVSDEAAPGGDGDTDLIRNVLREQVWGKVNQSIEEVLSAITLQDLLDSYERARNESSWVFNI